MAHLHGAAAPCNCYVLALVFACLLGAFAGQVTHDWQPPAGLLAVTRSPLTGEVIEWWVLGPDASARERELRAAHGDHAVQRAGGNPPRAAAWVGPDGERLAAGDAITLRYRQATARALAGGV